MNPVLKPFCGSFYAASLRGSMQDLAVPMWSAVELWGNKESPLNFRNCLVGSAEECARLWRRWSEEGFFETDSEPAYYALEQNFYFRGKKFVRWAVFGSVSVTDGSVKIHEAVSAEGAENTRRRFELSQADLTPIFIGIEQNQNFALPELLKSLLPAAEKILRFEEQGLSSHTLWRLSSGFEQIQAQFSARELFLLDGHHRFRGAQENFARGLGDGRLLACVTTISPEEVLILAIHRAIICEPWLLPESAVVSIEALGCRIVERVRWSRERLEDIVHDTDWTKGDFYLLPTQSAELFLMKLPEQKKPALVVDRIENEILSKIREANSLPANDLLFLVDQLASGQAQAAILLPPLTGADVLSAARANSVLPRKSTQFYPKPALGLICRPWD